MWVGIVNTHRENGKFDLLHCGTDGAQKSADSRDYGCSRPGADHAFVRSSAPSESIDFTPGQVAILRVEGEEPAYFAFASAPEDRDLEVLVKQKVGASRVIYDMCVGDEIELVGVPGMGSSSTR